MPCELVAQAVPIAVEFRLLRLAIEGSVGLFSLESLGLDGDAVLIEVG